LTSIAFTNIATLVTNTADGEGNLGLWKNATLVSENGIVTWVGPSAAAPSGTEVHVDCSGRTLLPGFVNSHNHLAFAGDRSQEFAARMSGEPYSAGGIHSTVSATREASDDELRRGLAIRANEMIRHGITTYETKSGYGLTQADEYRLLRLSSEMTPETTLLAHVVPTDIVADRYVSLFTEEIIDTCAEFARWIDVFCEEGAFTTEQAQHILTVGANRGLGLRAHVSQLAPSDAAAMAVQLGAASIDHCNHLTDADIDLVSDSDTVATLLPAADFSTRSKYAPARQLLDAGTTVALATNCNPGSSFTTSMAFCIAIAVRDMHMSVEEALLAATRGGALALRRSDVGHLGVGASADFILLETPSYLHLAYRPGMDLVDAVYQQGTLAYERSK
jgi:imidazolonepropionase